MVRKTNTERIKREKIYLTIAGFIIRISFLKSQEYFHLENNFISLIKDYYKDFLIKKSFVKSIDYTIEVEYSSIIRTLQNKSQKDIFVNFYKELGLKKIKTFYHVSGIQFQLIMRRIIYELLSQNDGFIFHASAAKRKNKAYIFLGDSGAGKSSIITFLSPEFIPMGDDTIIIRKQEGEYFCYSSSAIEKNYWFPKRGNRIILEKVFFLRKKKIHTAKFIKNKETVVALLGKQVYTKIDDLGSHFPGIIDFINTFEKFYTLEFALENKSKLERLIEK